MKDRHRNIWSHQIDGYWQSLLGSSKYADAATASTTFSLQQTRLESLHGICLPPTISKWSKGVHMPRTTTTTTTIATIVMMMSILVRGQHSIHYTGAFLRSCR